MLVKTYGGKGQSRYIRVDPSRVEKIEILPDKGTILVGNDKDGKGGLFITTTPEEAQRVADAIRTLEGYPARPCERVRFRLIIDRH